jgi:hypothetical protein
MRKAAVMLGLVGFLSPPAVRAEGVAIDHQAVGCVVAGKYPRLNACFAPRSSLARARVYFRVADAPPDWYYVEMTAGTPCHAGTLPRPKKELIGRRIQYYMDAFDRSFTESRTPEKEALVVANASECNSKLPVAPVLNSATVAVFPGLPAGFAGGAAGLGAGAAAVLAVGGAAVVGGGVAVAAGGDSGSTSTPTTTLPPVGGEPTTTTIPTTTTTTTTLVSDFHPDFKVFDGSTLVTGNTVVGNEPLVLRFNMCDSTGPFPMRFAVEVDGAIETNGCNSFITFTTASASSDLQGAGVRHSATARTYAVRMTIQSIAPNNDPKGHRNLTVQVNPGTTPPGGCSTDKQGPVVTMTKPASGSLYPSPNPYPVHFEASASDATTGNNGVVLVEYKVNYPGPTQAILGPVTSGSPWPYDWTASAVNAYLGTRCAGFLEVQAYAQDSCGNATYSAKTQVIVNNTGTCVPDQDPGASAASATIVSELGVPGGAGQIVANDHAAFPRVGRSPLPVRVEPGDNRVEATLVEARSAGTWRFELGGVPGFHPESLRVVAGEVLQLAGDSVTFRLQGQPGERVVFVFRAN